MYRRLLKLYPANHRRTFGEQMVQAFGDHYRDVVEARGGSRVRFWLAVLADTGTSLLAEYKYERRHRPRTRTKRVRIRKPPIRRIVLAVLVWLGFKRPRVPAGVREPRRPRPESPAGAAARPRNDQEPVALISREGGMPASTSW